jgi:hypothetical protein
LALEGTRSALEGRRSALGAERSALRGAGSALERARFARDVLLHLLEVKFRPLDERTKARVRAAGQDRLFRWAERLITADRLADVFRR